MSRFDLREYVDSRLGIRMVTAGGHGEELVCTCPFCGKADKFYVNPKRGRWICYKCNEKGGVVGLVAQMEGLAYKDAMRYVVERAVRLPSRSAEEISRSIAESDDETVEKSRGLALPPNFVPVFDGKTWRVPAYLRERKITARVAAQYGVGTCGAGCGVNCRLLSPDRHQCEACRYAGRIVVPAHVFGELVFYQGRSMTGAIPKYLAPALDRSSILLGLDEAAGSDHVLVVEGPFDVLGCAQAGLPAVALMGKVCSMAQASLLARAGFSRATFMLDPEASRDAVRATAVLSEVLEVDFARLPDGCDPGNAPRDVIVAAAAAARPPTLRDRLLAK